MSSLEILAFPNPFLRHEASQVTQFDSELASLISNMCETMHQNDGVGLAATQVGRDLQLLVLSSYVFQSPEERKRIGEMGETMGEDIVLINPKVLEQSEDEVIDYEGCLSFPDVYIKVSRPYWVKVQAQRMDGSFFEIEGEEFGARALLHEMDHLIGKVMTDHLSFVSRQRALNRHKKIQRTLKERKNQERLDAIDIASSELKSDEIVSDTQQNLKEEKSTTMKKMGKNPKSAKLERGGRGKKKKKSRKKRK